jgi:hypothetical protein
MNKQDTERDASGTERDAADVEAIVDELIGARERRTTVSQTRRANERSMREAQSRASCKRRIETLVRASRPRERPSKRTAQFVQARIQKPELLHPQRLEAFAMRREDTRTLERELGPRAHPGDDDWENVYRANYRELEMRLLAALADADDIDQRADRERLAAGARVRQRADLDSHKARMTPVLLAICPSHGTGAKMRPEETVGASSLTGYFSPAQGETRRKTIREFHVFFSNQVVEARALVTAWPTPPGQSDAASESSEVGQVDSDFVCATCNGELVFDHRTGSTTCTMCGVSRAGGMGLGVQQTFADSQASSRTAAPYERIAHFKEFIARLEGTERTEIPEIVVNTLLLQCAMHRIDPIREHERVTYAFVRGALQRTGYCQFFENTTQLVGILTKRQPRRFTDEEKAQLSRIFREIQVPFERHKGKRKNFLSYSFTLYKLCELLGMCEFLPYLPLLKAPANLLAADALWEKICNDLNYEFVRTS